MKRPTIKWWEFSSNGAKYLGDYKVVRKDGSYWEIKYFSPYSTDLGKRVKKTKGMYKGKSGLHRCFKCEGIKRVKYVIPFNLKFLPGWYCYSCRRKNDILDIKIARKHGKIS